MVDRLRLVTNPMADSLLLLLLTTLAFCEDKDNSLEVLPISLPPSQLWYVI